VRGLIFYLQRHQFHKACDHFGRTQYSQFLQFASSTSNLFVVVEIRPDLWILCEVTHYLEALTVKPLVYVTSTLQKHHLNLALSRLEGENAPQDRADDCTYDTRCGGQDCWIHFEFDLRE